MSTRWSSVSATATINNNNTTMSHLWPCDCQLINSNNTTTNNNNDNFNIHDDDGHHLHHLFITTKKKVAWMKAGPNNVPDSIWAQVSFLFSSFVLLETKEFFIVNIGCIYDIGERERVGRPGTMKMGQTMWDALLGSRWVFSYYFLCIIWY